MKRAFLIPCLFLFACSHQASVTQQDPDEATENLQNEITLNQIHQTDSRELALAQVAMDGTQGFEVQQLAQSILANHQEIESRLKVLAKEEGVTLAPYQPTPTDKIAFQRLKELKGKSFDEAIRWALRESQDRTAVVFHDIVLHAEEPGVVVMLADMLPKIRKQEQQAANALSDFNELDVSAQAQP